MKVQIHLEKSEIIFFSLATLLVLSLAFLWSALAVDTSKPWHPLSQIQIDQNLDLGDYNLSANQINASKFWQNGEELALKSWVSENYLKKSGGTVSGDLNVNGNLSVSGDIISEKRVFGHWGYPAIVGIWHAGIFSPCENGNCDNNLAEPVESVGPIYWTARGALIIEERYYAETGGPFSWLFADFYVNVTEETAIDITIFHDDNLYVYVDREKITKEAGHGESTIQLTLSKGRHHIRFAVDNSGGRFQALQIFTRWIDDNKIKIDYDAFYKALGTYPQSL